MATLSLDHLNPQQREAVTHLGSPLLVLAGAGSGKTGVITHKIAWLIQVANLAAYEVAAVTFTNKAANEMKHRVKQLLGGKTPRGLRISTFHTLGLEIVRKEAKLLGFHGPISIYDSRDTLMLLGQLAQDTPFDGNAKMLINLIGNWKNNNQSPEQIEQNADEPELRIAANIYARYMEVMQSYSAVDFDDLIRLPLKLFTENAVVLSRWQARIKYLLVDEYQDTNPSQYALVKALVGERGNLTVVGDDDQSIYAWRGADPEHMASLQNDFPGLKIIPLEQNYRSTSRILRVANTLIAQNPHVFEKSLWSELGEGPKITVSQCRDEEHEIERVIAQITTHKYENSKDFKDFAVLYRSNYQSRILEQQLRLAGIPYQLSGGTSFFEHAEIKDLMAYFRVILNPNDDTALRRIANVPRREIGPATLEKLSRYAAQRQVPMSVAGLEIGLEKEMDSRAQARVRSLLYWLDDIRDRMNQAEDPVPIIIEMMAEMNYNEYLSSEANSPKAFERKQKNVDELLSWLRRMNEKSVAETGETMTFEERVTRVALMDRLERQEGEEAPDAITLMTLHTAKGLEFDHVHIIGFEEELLPHKNSLEEGMLEEERRLAYVGITRAKRKLHITYAQKRRRGKGFVEVDPSRFLDELPKEDLDWKGSDNEPSKEENMAYGRARMEELLDFLSD